MVKKHIKWGVWRVAVFPSYIKDARFLKVNWIFQARALLTFVNKSRQGQEQNLPDQLLVTVIPIDVLSDVSF